MQCIDILISSFFKSFYWTRVLRPPSAVSSILKFTSASIFSSTFILCKPNSFLSYEILHCIIYLVFDFFVFWIFYLKRTFGLFFCLYRNEILHFGYYHFQKGFQTSSKTASFCLLEYLNLFLFSEISVI